MSYGSGLVYGPYRDPESVVPIFWPQYFEHGCGLRNPAGGAGSWSGLAAFAVLAVRFCARSVVATIWSMPTVPATAPAIDAGTENEPLASRTRCPATL